MSMDKPGVYDFKLNTVTLNGIIVSGYMDGTGISHEKNEDNVIRHVGADGSVTYSKSNDDTGLLTLTLKQTSSTLKSIRKWANENTPIDLSVSNNNTNGVKLNSPSCYIQKTPGEEAANEISGVEVIIEVPVYKPQ